MLTMVVTIKVFRFCSPKLLSFAFAREAYSHAKKHPEIISKNAYVDLNTRITLDRKFNYLE